MKNTVRKSLSTALITTMLLTVGLSSVRAEEQTISERVMHYRAIDAVVWAMPLLNFKTFRDGHKAIGVDYKTSRTIPRSRIGNFRPRRPMTRRLTSIFSGT